MATDVFSVGIERLKKENEATQQDASKASDTRTLDVLICGSERSGKSTLVDRFLERTPSDAPTFGLSYKYASKTRVDRRDLANIWELGNGGRLASLIDCCVSPASISRLSVIVCLDLTRPDTYEALLRPLLDALKRQIDAARNAKSGTTTFATASNPPDGCFALGIPMAIVSARYDEFQNVDTEKKRRVFRLLRYLAHINGASLLTFSSRVETLVARGKSLLAQFGFDAPANKTSAVDIHAPVFVPAFTDTLESIGALGASRPPSIGSHTDAMAHFYAALAESFPQVAPTPIVRTTTNADQEDSLQFAEPLIDAAIEERYRELEYMSREQRARAT